MPSIDLELIEKAQSRITANNNSAHWLCEIFNTDWRWCKSRQLKYKTVGLIQHDRVLNGKYI